MTRRITIPIIGAAEAWRKAARGALQDGISPDQITWGDADAPVDLFDTFEVARGRAEAVTVPRSFIALANRVVWHSDPSRFARLYGFVWRLRDAPHLITDRGDADLATLRAMEKNVRRCQHKMKAFVRFREIGEAEANRRSFAAWFEPTHFTVEPTADFFVRRFADMDWRIYTPSVSAVFEDGKLRLEAGCDKPDLPHDGGEELWVTYFQNIFNPARLKVQAMTSEMPKKYWKNMPEAASIPQMIADAPARARAMAEAVPTLPHIRVDRVLAQAQAHQSAWDGPAAGLPAAIRNCARCELACHATQAVLGEGPKTAPLMIVGEQPGDKEDLQGRPFVGPAGQLFDEIAEEVGLDRSQAYVTNAVKHFKFKAQGRRRIHQRPNRSEIDQCRWWLDAEVRRVAPRLIVAMGATAAEALTGNGDAILKRRGTIQIADGHPPVLITLHPSYILRARDIDTRLQAAEQLRVDLRRAVDLVAAPRKLASA